MCFRFIELMYAKTFSTFPFQLNQICYSSCSKFETLFSPYSSISCDLHSLRFLA